MVPGCIYPHFNHPSLITDKSHQQIPQNMSESLVESIRAKSDYASVSIHRRNEKGK